VTFDLRTADGIAHYRRFLDEAADLVIGYGGVLSGEHGDGQARAELLTKLYGDQMITLFREFKSLWDPEWKMNPGKVIDPDPVVKNLRLGANYQPWDPETHFRYPDDKFSFARASLRCVGVGKCRRQEPDNDVMCPSYMATGEEKHSTRGRARLLFEMLMGDAVHDGWRSEAVKEALDLCLACKGCKTDCPVNVDMATYKAEFAAHYYSGRLRPITAYTLGLIYWWARLASKMPWLVNAVTQAPGLNYLFKKLGGIAPQREIPTFAAQTFKSWFQQRDLTNSASTRRPVRSRPQWSPLKGKDVILWSDTFNNHLTPQIAIAATEVLESAGFNVVVPQQTLCCGRPLYDFGFLDQAKAQLAQIMDALRPQIRAGIPIVGLEPSCVSVFRDELHNLYPNDEDANRLGKQVFTLPEFIERHADDFEIPALEREARVHIHCHHHAIISRDAEEWLLDRIGLDYAFINSGCCGMAGSFGYEAEKYDVSIACAEQTLIPTVTGADPATLIIADGFSCRSQINHLSERRPLHIAQVLQMALRGEADDLPHHHRPHHHREEAGKGRSILEKALLGVGAMLAAGLVTWGVKQLMDNPPNGETDAEIVHMRYESIEQRRQRDGI
jgi:Fe-S oxidoreductase